MTQSTFDFEKIEVSDKLRLEMLHLLSVMDDWISAADLAESIGLPANERGKRMIRQMIEDSPGQVISGQMGYKHIEMADADEVTHYANRLMSHGRKEIEAAKFALKAKGLQ